jgi:hypothetical protein
LTHSIHNFYGSVIDALLRLDRAHVAETLLIGVHIGDGSAAIAAEGLTVDGDHAMQQRLHRIRVD